MDTKTEMTFCTQLAKLSIRPGFRDEASKVAFGACAHELLGKGVSEANTLQAMEMIYVSATEYIGSFEAIWDADYYLRDQGLEVEWIHKFLSKARGHLDWVRKGAVPEKPDTGDLGNDPAIEKAYHEAR